MLISPRRWTTKHRCRRMINGTLYAFVLCGDSIVVFRYSDSPWGMAWFLAHNFEAEETS